MFNQVENIVNEYVEKYNNVLVSKYNLSIDELRKHWSDISGQKLNYVTQQQNHLVSVQVQPQSVQVQQTEPINTGCIFILTRGDRKGKPCGKKLSDTQYCRTHKAKMGSLSKTSESKGESKQEPKNVIKLVKHKELDVMHDTSTGFVFDVNDGAVYGIIMEGVINSLSKKDIALCVEKGFKYKIVEKKEKKEKKEEKKDKEQVENNKNEGIQNHVNIFKKDTKDLNKLITQKLMEDVDNVKEEKNEKGVNDDVDNKDGKDGKDGKDCKDDKDDKISENNKNSKNNKDVLQTNNSLSKSITNVLISTDENEDELFE